MSRVQKVFAFLVFIIFFIFFLDSYLKPVDFKFFLHSWAQTFQKSASLQIQLPISDLIRSRNEAELNQVDLFLPHYFKYEYTEITALQKFTENCEKIKNTVISKELAKAWALQEAICHNKTLDLSFFQQAPFLHPSGQSYTKMAVVHKIISFNESLKNTLTLKEIIELEFKLNKLSLSQIDQLKDKTHFLVTNDFVFLLKEREYANQIYEVYSTEDWEHFLKNQDFTYQANEKAAARCLEVFGEGCWVEKQSLSSRIIQLLAVLLILSIIVVLCLYFFFSRKNMKLKIQEEEKRKFALQMLTHELRTPATSLSFLVENIRRDFDQLNEKHKVDFMKICDEVFRLQNMTRISYQYLQTDSLKEDLKLNLIEKDLLDYLQNINEKFKNKIYISSSHSKINLKIDWFWIDICLQNLLRNAFEHGKENVQIQIEVNPRTLCLSVVDDGNIQIPEENLFEAFKKNHESSGMGLGLSLVKKILTTIQINLHFKAQPKTEFKLTISRDIYEYTFS